MHHNTIPGDLNRIFAHILRADGNTNRIQRIARCGSIELPGGQRYCLPAAADKQ